MTPHLRSEQLSDATIFIHVEAASPSSVRWTLDPGGKARVWQVAVINPDEVAIAASTSTRETSEALVGSVLTFVRHSVPSLIVQDLDMRPEPMENGNAEVVATGPVRFLRSEWEAAKRLITWDED